MEKRVKGILKRTAATALSAAMIVTLGFGSVPSIVLAQDGSTGIEQQNDAQEVKIELSEITSMSAKSYGPSGDGNTLEASFDGDTTTYTNSNYFDPASGKPQVYTFNFGGEVNLCKVRIHPRNSGGAVGNGAPNRCIVEVSTDGNIYTQVADQTVDDTALTWTDISFTAVAATSVRLTLDSAHPDVVSTGEIELYKTAAETSAADKTALQKLYNEVKDAEFAYPDNSYYTKFTTALSTAADVLESEDADQGSVDAAYNSLEQFYWLNMVNDKVAYYNPNKQGQDGRFVYTDRPTESILPVVAAYLEGRNTSSGSSTEKLKACYDAFTEAETLIQEPAENLQGVQTGLVLDAVDADNPGHFEITKEEAVTENESTLIKVSFTFVNDGIDSVTQKDIGAYSLSRMTKAKFRVHYTNAEGGGGTKFVSSDDIEPLNGSYSNGVTGEFTVNPDSTIYLEMYYQSDDTYMPGYYKVISAVPAVDKTELQKLYDEVKDAEFTYPNSTFYNRFTQALEKAETVLEDAEAVQKDVDSAYNNLEKYYWLNMLNDKVSYYNPSKEGQDGRFVYSDKITESILPYIAAFKVGRNVSVNAELDKIMSAYNAFIEAEKNEAVTAEPDQRGVEIGFNAEGGLGALQSGNSGHFEITGEEFVTGDDGQVQVKVSFNFINDGINPVTGEAGSKYSLADMTKAYCTVHYSAPAVSGAKSPSSLDKLDGSYSNGVTGEVIVPLDSTISLSLEDSTMPGYYKVQKFTPADKTLLQHVLDTAAEAIEQEYNYQKNDNWNAFLASYEAAKDVYDDPAATETEVTNAVQDLSGKYLVIKLETEAPEAVFVINGEDREITEDALLNEAFDLKFTDNGKLFQFVLNGTEFSIDGTEDTAAFADIQAALNEGNGEDGKNVLVVRDSVPPVQGTYLNESTYTFYFDQTAPALGEPEYIENEDGSVTVKIEVGEEIDQSRLPEGWIYEDGAVTKTFTDSAEEEVVIYDAAGNASSVTVEAAVTEEPENPQDPKPEDPQKPGTGDAEKPSADKPADTQKPAGNNADAGRAVLTGDENSPVVWIVVLVAACVAVGAVIVIKRKK